LVSNNSCFKVSLLTQTIANQEYYYNRLIGSIKSHDIRALRVIIIELIQGYTKDNRAISLNDLYY
jgi:hypothetical protein